MKLLYSEKGVGVYHGDGVHLLEEFEGDTVYLDPPWPGPGDRIFGVDSWGLFREFMGAIRPSVRTLLVHLGRFSDPRFMACVPRRLDFQCVIKLRWSYVSYRGRLLNDSDYVYVFGALPARLGSHGVLPGEFTSYRMDRVPLSHHPCGRDLNHVRGLLGHYAGERVCDPCGGSLTTALACLQLGKSCVTSDVVEGYLKHSIERLRCRQLDLTGLCGEVEQQELVLGG